MAAVLIGGLGYKVLFEKRPQMQQYRQQTGDPKGAKSISPYHDFQVKNTIMKNRGDIIKCYNTFIETKPQITDGRLKVDFEIDDNGEVIHAEKVTGPFVDETFLSCVTGNIKKWKFPEPNIPTPVYVEHTFHFSQRVNIEDTSANKK